MTAVDRELKGVVRVTDDSFSLPSLTATNKSFARASDVMQVRSLHGRHCLEGSACSAASTLEQHA